MQRQSDRQSEGQFGGADTRGSQIRRRTVAARGAVVLTILFGMAGLASPGKSADATLLNVSYDPTRELYVELNAVFAAQMKGKDGSQIEIKQSHGGSGAQARAVSEGLEADVVTLAVATDIDMIAKRGLLSADWQKRLPQNASPYTSTIVFLVREGNPKTIRDWDDLVRPGIGIVTPNPKTSGGARWNYLAAWGFAARKYGSEQKAEDFVKALFANVLVMDNGARGATTTFTNRGVGDVLLAWENEAHLALASNDGKKYQIVAPSQSVLAEPPVAIIDKYTAKHGTQALAEKYLQFLYTAPAQDIIARHHYRPRDPAAAEKYRANFPAMELFDVETQFGGWPKAHAAHFASGGSFDRIYMK